MPEPADTVDSRSPVRRALSRFWASRSAKVGVVILFIYVLFGIYAPFLASDLALVWWGPEGPSFPAFSALFNRFVYPDHHDFVFNMLALAFPLVLGLALILRKWWNPWRVLRNGMLLALGFGLAGLLSADVLLAIACAAAIWWGGALSARRVQNIRRAGLLRWGALALALVVLGLSRYAALEWDALWRERGAPSETYAAMQRSQRLQQGDVAELAERGDRLLTDDGELVRVLFRTTRPVDAQGRPILDPSAVPDPDGAGSPARAIFFAVVPRPGAEPLYLAPEQLRPVPLHLTVFPPVPHRYDQPYEGSVLAGPGEICPATGFPFLLGADGTGRDVFARLAFGARISLTIGVLATCLSMTIGVIIGAISGYFGGWVDLVLQRLVEIMMMFPRFLLVLVIIAMVGRNLMVIIVVFAVTGWAGTSRLVRGEFLALSGREFVPAA
ncbi:MAG: ABC transporter permease, partial [Planctomycetota bacterium]